MKAQLVLFLTFIFMGTNIPSTQAQSNSKWVKKYYDIQGQWSIQKDNGKTLIVFGDDFKTKRGPDVKVYLATKKIEDINKRESVNKDGVFLGKLGKFSGKQSFIVPPSVSLDNYNSIVIHCKAYSVVWGGINLR